VQRIHSLQKQPTTLLKLKPLIWAITKNTGNLTTKAQKAHKGEKRLRNLALRVPLCALVVNILPLSFSLNPVF
jgi:hypothetical protein